MDLIREFRGGAWFLGKVPQGADLAAFLDEFVRAKGIRSGVIGVIGVVTKAKLGYLDASNGKYIVTDVASHREIASCQGDVSIKVDGKPGVHAHIVLSDPQGHTLGGHLLDGTTVHYAEFWVATFDGLPFERGFDASTNVTGWVR